MSRAPVGTAPAPVRGELDAEVAVEAGGGGLVAFRLHVAVGVGRLRDRGVAELGLHPPHIGAVTEMASVCAFRGSRRPEERLCCAAISGCTASEMLVSVRRYRLEVRRAPVVVVFDYNKPSLRRNVGRCLAADATNRRPPRPLAPARSNGPCGRAQG